MPSSPRSPSIRPKGRTSRASSFHGRLPGTTPPAEPMASAAVPLRRPKTVPDLHASSRLRLPNSTASPSSSPAATPQRVPSKVLVSVTLLRTLGALQVVASTDWTVAELIAATVRQYAKEGRRPLLQGGSDSKDYALHYSQFSLQPIPTEEKLINLGSRSFFLCPKYQQQQQQQAQQHHDMEMLTAATASPVASRSSTHPCSNEANREDLRLHTSTSSFPRRPWLRFIDFLL